MELRKLIMIAVGIAVLGGVLWFGIVVGVVSIVKWIW